MKKILWAGLLALPLLALPGRAFAWGTVPQPTCNANIGFNLNFASGGAQAGPWYQYWPLEAHFQPPAPTGYPYWPPPMTLPLAPQHAAPPQPLPPVQAAPLKPVSFQPVGYYYYGQPPNYWYPR
jgi:hypothetical protein